jgi:hypothetical protein
MRMFLRLRLRAKPQSLNRRWQNRKCLNHKGTSGQVGDNYSPLNRSPRRRMRPVVEDAGEAAVVEGAAAAERGLLQLHRKLQPPLLQKRTSLKQLVPHRHQE